MSIDWKFYYIYRLGYIFELYNIKNIFDKMRNGYEIIGTILIALMALNGVFSIMILLASDSIAAGTEHTCKIVEEIHLDSDKKLAYTLCLEEQSRCGHDAGQICSVGLSKEVARKICRWVPKIECSSGVADT